MGSRAIGVATRTSFAMWLLGFSAVALADWDLNLPVGVTPLSRTVYDLHMLILWICVLIGIVVFGAMLYSIVAHRKSVGYKAAHFHHSTFAEIVWTVVPTVILVGLAVPSTYTLIEMEDTSESDLTIKVTGYQWKWRYDYIEDGLTLYSNLAPENRAAIYREGGPQGQEAYLLEVDNRIVLPVDKKVRFLLTADDVIHAWWVPALGMKKDAIPGFINEIWAKIETPGIYRGQCAELCGKDHGFMPIVVEATSEAEYQAWVEQQHAATAAAQAAALENWSKAELMAKGEMVYAAACAGCHQLDGAGVPHNFPAIKGSEVATGDLTDHLRLVLDGRTGTAMKPFGQQLNAIELAAVVTYQRNAFGNDTGDVVQPSQVVAAREVNIGG